MKLFAVVFIIFFFMPVLALSQQKITGFVVSAATNNPIAGGSVFISNTVKGTVSDKQGYFEINDIPPGKYDLVISSVGYETNVYSFSADQLPLKLRINLQVKVRELENVTVEPSLEEGWDKWGKVFTDNFVGLTPNANQCKIKNTKAIRFRYYKKSNRLIAYSDEPIILENRALGYRIIYQLEDFEIKYKEGSSAFAGFPLFEDMEKNGRSLRSRWQRSRDKAYYGSMMHFMRSVYKDDLDEQGFFVRRMQRIPNLEKQRVKNIYQHGRTVFKTGNNISISLGQADSSRKDSTAYYERVLSKEDYTEVYGKDYLHADSLVVEDDGQYKAILFADYLHVTFKKETEEKEYILTRRESRNPSFQQSYLWLPNQHGILIDANGSYFPPQEVFSFGYWGWDEKMANLLPLDFQPER